MSGTPPLAGITVLDLSRVYSGPLATLLLADLGAEVIKVEHPAYGDDSRSFGPFVGDTSGYFETLNRGKRSIAVDYTTLEGQSILRALAGRADILVENFRPGQMSKYNLDYAAVSALYPQLVYVSINGFGEGSEAAQLGCYDVVAQAEGGLMAMTGPEGQPCKAGPPVADALTGLMAATGLLAALFRRERTGVGAHIEIAMVDTVFACLENALAAYDISGRVPGPQGSSDAVLAPFDAFRADDGWVVIGIGNDRLWRSFAGLISEDLAHDQRFETNTGRVAAYDILRPVIEAWCSGQSVSDVLARLHQNGIPSGAVRTIDELACDPRLEARGMLVRLPLGGDTSVLVPGSPIRFDDLRHGDARRGPRLGEDTLAICREIVKLDETELTGLLQRGVIGAAATQNPLASKI